MQLGCSTWGMPTVPIEEALAGIARIGYRGVEITVIPGYTTALEQLDAAERRRQLAAETGELAGELMTTLVGAGWSLQDARDANIRSLIWPEADQ